MIYKIILHREVVGELKSLPKKIRERVRETIDGLATQPIPTGAARLKGRSNAYKIRFGSYRLLYEINATEIVVYVMGVAHRREVYLRLLRR